MSMQDTSDRLKRMRIYRQALCDLFSSMAKRKCIPWTNELPEDTIVVDAYYDALEDCFTLVLSSKEFPKVILGQILEEIVVRYQWVEVKNIGPEEASA